MRRYARVFVFPLFVASCVFAQISTDSLIAYYPFNGTANDASGNGHNGTVRGATLTTDRFLSSNNAYSFDGSDTIIADSSSVFKKLNNRAVTAWVLSTATGDQGIAGYIGTNGRDGFLLMVHNTGKMVMLEDWQTTWGYATSNQNLAGDGKWHFLVGLRKNDTTFLYVDGIKQTVFMVQGAIFAANSKVVIGSSLNPNRSAPQNFSGKIDNVRFFNRALTDSEIQLLYQEGNSYNCDRSSSSGVPASFSVDSSFNSIVSTFNTSIFSSIDTLFLCYETANLTYLTQRVDRQANYTVNVGGAVADFGNNISTATFSPKSVNITALKALSANFQVTFNYTGGGGEILFSNPYLLVYGAKDGLTGSAQKSILRPQSLMKASAFPNPVRTTATINYSIPSTSPLNISIYNADGKLVKNVFSGLRQAGAFNYLWDGTNLSGSAVANGNYFFRVKAANGQQVLEKVVVLK